MAGRRAGVFGNAISGFQRMKLLKLCAMCVADELPDGGKRQAPAQERKRVLLLNMRGEEENMVLSAKLKEEFEVDGLAVSEKKDFAAVLERLGSGAGVDIVLIDIGGSRNPELFGALVEGIKKLRKEEGARRGIAVMGRGLELKDKLYLFRSGALRVVDEIEGIDKAVDGVRSELKSCLAEPYGGVEKNGSGI